MNRPRGANDDGVALDLSLGDQALLRLVDPAAEDVRAIESRLGLTAAVPGPDAAPLLTIRYVPTLAVDSALRTVGKDDGAFDERSFVVRARGRAVAIVDFEHIGQPGAEIVARRGSGVPGRLVSMLNLAMLGGRGIALHASAVELDGLGIAACGWSGSGKTEAMLGLMHLGGRFVGDEWTYLQDGRLVGLPERVRIQDWHAAQLPWLRGQVSRGATWRMGAAATAQRGGSWLGRAPIPGVRSVARGAQRVGGRRHVDLPVAALFDAPRRAASTALDRLVLLEPSTAPGIRAEPIDPLLVARRLALAHVHHRRELLGWYWQARFAFPDRRNALLDDIEAVERQRLEVALAGRPAVRIEHPHVVDIAELGRVIAEAVR
jgi:hypothetical protein